MNSFFKVAFLIYILIINNTSCFSQNSNQMLIDKLNDIEKKYSVSFSYVDVSIKHLKVTLNYKSKEPLASVLKKIEVLTNLKFTFLSDKFITINTVRKKQKTVPYVNQLKEIYVSSYLTSGITKSSNGAVQITPEKIGILPGLAEPDILQTVQALPGVLSANEDVSNINIRGGTPDQNLVLYDGIRMYQTGHFFGLISAFNPNLVKNISVHRHGTQARYGNSVSSVLSMNLLDHVTKKVKAGVGANLLSINGFAIVPITKKIGIQFSARRSITDKIKTITYNKYFERIFQDSDLTNIDDAAISKNENFYFYDTAFKLLCNISKHDKLRLNVLAINNILDYEEDTVIEINNNTSRSTKSELKQESLALGLNYSRQWNTKLKTNILLYQSKYKLGGQNNNVLQNQNLIQNNNVNNYGLKFHAIQKPTKNLDIQLGYDLSQLEVTSLEKINNPQFERITKQFLITHAPYLEGHYVSANKAFKSTLGARYNYINKFNTHILEPRFNISLRLFKNFRIGISGEYKSQYISQVIDLQNDFLGIEKRRWVLADNNINPITKSKQGALSLVYNKRNFLINVEAFIKHVNGITSPGQGFQNQYQFVYSTGDYNIKGIDFLINKQFVNFKTWLSYSLSKNNYRFQDFNNNALFPNNIDINHTVNFSTTYKFNHLKIALGMNWHSAKPTTKPDLNAPIHRGSINFSEPNSSRLPNYFRVDFSSTYKLQLKKGKLEMGAAIWNVFNKKNIINSYYQLSNNRVSKINNSALTMTPNLSFRFWF